LDPGLEWGDVAVRSSISPSKAWRTVTLWLLPVFFLAAFYFTPLVEIIQRSDILRQGLHLSASEWAIIVKPLMFTVAQALASTALTLCIGLPGAYILSHYRFPGRDLFKALLIVPFILPTVVVSACFNSLLGPSGLINNSLISLLQLETPPILLLNSFWAIILGHVFYNTSIIMLIVAEAWSNLNPGYNASARVLGASLIQTAIKVTLPLLAPAILSASLLVFIFDFTSFGVVLLLGGPLYATLEVEIYVQAIQMLNLRMSTILSLIQIVMTLGLSLVYTRVSRSQTLELNPEFKSGVSMKSAPAYQKILSLGVLLILFLLFISPLAALVIRSLAVTTDVSSGNIWTYYQALFTNRSNNLFYVPPAEAILNSILFGLITVVVTVPLGILVVLALSQPSCANRLLGPILMLPLGSSAVTLGLGLLLAYNDTWFSQIPFPLLLPVAHALVALPMVVRVLQPALEAIPLSLTQSARTLGANPWQVFRSIHLPILRGSILISVIFTFSISLGEFGATTFLNRPGYPTIPIAIFRFLTQPGQMNYGQAMAMSTILMMLCILGILIIQILSRRGTANIKWPNPNTPH
jgi:thiamine transport system permease protein